MSELLEGIPFACIAHRGASATHPENTLAAFEAAIRAGAHGIELDVQLTRDGVVVVLHDDDLERTTDGTGALAGRTREELRGLDAGSWKDARFAGEPIPTLAETLACVGDRVALLDVEIKGPPGEGLEDAVLADLERARRAGPLATVLLSSFARASLERCRALDPAVPLGLLYEEPPRDLAGDAARVGAASFHPGGSMVVGDFLAEATALGLPTLVWTVDDPAAARWLRERGARGVITNRVPEILAGLQA